MVYYVFESRSQSRARIHSSTCGYARRGMERHRVSLSASDNKWHGPFRTFATAKRRARSLGIGDTRACGHCVRWG